MKIRLSWTWDLAISGTLLGIVLLSHFKAAYVSPVFFASSLLLMGTVIAHLLIYVQSKDTSIADAVVLIFEILFLVVAPSLQLLSSGIYLPNTSMLNETYGVQTNIVFVIFIIFYLIARNSLKLNNTVERVLLQRHIGKTQISLLIILSVLAAYIAVDAMQIKLEESAEFTPVSLITKKFLGFIPVPFLMFLIVRKGMNVLRHPFWLFAFITALFCVLLSQNPLIEKRSGLGPVYIGIILTAVPSLTSNPRKFFIWLLFFMGVVFPLSSVFTHNTIEEWIPSLAGSGDVIFSHFLELHYDAWANAHTIIEMVDKQGIKWGDQALGALLFFVPRNLWEAKPLATGQVIGNYLAQYYSMWFNNLSSPMAAEAYLDFSFFGVIVMGIGLGWITRYLDGLVRSNDDVMRCTGIYFAVFLMYPLRGSLMVACAAAAGSYLAFRTVRFVIRTGVSRPVKNSVLLREEKI